MTDERNERNSFLLYQNFENQFSLLSMADRGMLITAIFEYSREGRVTLALSPIVQMAFSIVRDSLDRDAEAYREKCRRNAENGKKGGRPKKLEAEAYHEHNNQTEHNTSIDSVSFSVPKTERFFSEPKKADNDNDNDNDNGNGSVIVIEKENEKEKALPSCPAPKGETEAMPVLDAPAARDRRRGEPLSEKEQALANEARARAMAQYRAMMSLYAAPSG